MPDNEHSISFDAPDKRHWTFDRLPDGSVKITRFIGLSIGEITLTGADWATVVAAVSRSGVTEMARLTALELHNTNFKEYEESASVQETST